MNPNVEFWIIIIAFFCFFLLYYYFAKRSKNRVLQWSLRLWPIWTVIGILILAISSVGTNCYFPRTPTRTAITKIEMYNHAVNTFRTRYNGLPGDHSTITKYFSAEAYPGLQNGNGNRQIEGEEVVQFWKQLEAAELIPEQEGADGVREMPYKRDLSYFEKLNAGAEFYEPLGVVVYSSSGRNWHQIARYKTEGELKILPAFTPEEAFIWDSKIDDGRPFTGSVTIRSAAQDGSSRLDGDITQAEVGYEGGNAYACVNESDISDDAKKRMATYAIGNENLACSIRIRMN